MTIDEATKFFGTKTKIASLLDMTKASVSMWNREGSIPLPRQAQLQLLSRGRLRAEMPTPREFEK